MKLINTTFQKVNLTQNQARRPITMTNDVSESIATLCEMPLREVIGETADETIEAFTQAFEEHAIGIYEYGAPETIELPHVDMSNIHTFEITVDLNNGARYQLPHYLVMRGYVEGVIEDPSAKFHITSSLSYRLDDEDKARSVCSVLYGNATPGLPRALRTVDGVYASMLLAEDGHDSDSVDTRSSFYGGAAVIDSRETIPSHYLAKMVNANISIPSAIEDDLDYFTPSEMTAIHLTNGHEHQLIDRLRRHKIAGHRTLVVERSELDRLLNTSIVNNETAIFDSSRNLKPVADVWDNSAESFAAYTIMQYLHGGLEYKGITTLSLEIDQDGPIKPEYSTVNGFDNKAHTYADIIKVTEDIHDHFHRNGLLVTSNIEFNVNGVSTVTLSVDGGANRTFEYASFASAYCNPLIAKDDSGLNTLATTYNALFNALV